jgi:hypothetical protein
LFAEAGLCQPVADAILRAGGGIGRARPTSTTCVIALTDAQRQAKDAQSLGGHSDPKMAERYIERAPNDRLDRAT